MMLTIQLLAIAALLIGLYAARRHANRGRMHRAKKRGKPGHAPRMSARTEMRAFDSMTTVTRTIDINAARRDRALRKQRHASKRRAAS